MCGPRGPRPDRGHRMLHCASLESVFFHRIQHCDCTGTFQPVVVVHSFVLH